MNKATLANPNHTLGVTTPALTGRCCGSPVFVPPTPAASHGVSTLRLSSPYLQYDSNGTFRNVPLLLSHARLCAGWFDAYLGKACALPRRIKSGQQRLAADRESFIFFHSTPDGERFSYSLPKLLTQSQNKTSHLSP